MTFADRAKQIPAALPFGAHVGHENFSGFGLRAHVQERAAPLIRALKQSRFPGPTCGGCRHASVRQRRTALQVGHLRQGRLGPDAHSLGSAIVAHSRCSLGF